MGVAGSGEGDGVRRAGEPAGRRVSSGRADAAPNDTEGLREALTAERARAHAVLETAVDAIVTIDARGTVQSANPATERLFGYPVSDLIGSNVNVLMASPYRQEHDGYLAHYLETGERKIIGIGREVEGRHRDGTRIPIDLAVSEFEVGGRRFFTGLIRDLRDRKQAEATLRDSAERLQLMSDSLPILIAYVEPDSSCPFTNRAFRESLLSDREARDPAGPPRLDSCFPPSDFRKLEPHLRRAFEGHGSTFETRLTLGDAPSRSVQVDCVPHRPTEIPNSDVAGLYLLIRDITNHKEAEAQRRQQEKLAAVGQLASGLAHEIGNPLSSISAVAQTVARKIEAEDLKAKLGLIGHHIQRVNRIVRQLVDFARPARVEWKSCCLNDLLRESLDIVRHDKRAKGVEIDYELEEPLPPVFVMPDLLQQVFINLALNAFDALEEATVEVPRLGVQTRKTPTGFVIVFRDNGPGIPASILDRVLEPFFTTKDVGKGSGLGLAVSHGILHEHGGSITVRALDGTPGATFVIELPDREAPPRE